MSFEMNPWHEEWNKSEARAVQLKIALREALAISRGMESKKGVDDARIKAWRRTSHALLHPNDSSASKPGVNHGST